MATSGVYAPARLGRHELLARLATGGMGEIFLARLEGAAGFEKLNVVKRILPHLADDARFRAMLIAEARIASKMAHPNICQVYELGETDGQLFIVMEYLEGIALLPLLRKASKDGIALPFGLVAGVVQQCCDALHYAHELRDHDHELLGIIHRDVTPGNIFLTDAGIAKLLDFGIAKVKDPSANTQTGTVKGKYAYMAPEQLRGSAIDRRVDVFALGIVIFEMLALRRLFQRKTDYLTFRAVMEQPIPDVRRYRPDTPDALADAVMGALDRDPVRRPDTARALGAAILGALGAAGERAWSQSEIGDFVRAHFAGEINRRRSEAGRAAGRGGADRLTMPLITVDDSAPELDDDDDGFPAIESTIADDAPPGAHDFSGQTPPPFGAESRTSGKQVVPLDAQAPPAPVVIVHKRSLFWPLIALAMVAIAGTALFLVWRQQRQQGPTQEFKIVPADPVPPVPSKDRTDPEPPTREPEPPRREPEPPARGSDVKRHPVPPQETSIYHAVIEARIPAMKPCYDEDPFSTDGARVIIKLAASGAIKSISFTPAALGDRPAGRCIAGVVQRTRFPKADTDQTLKFSLKTVEL